MVINLDVQFVSENYIKQNSVMPSYLDAKFITPGIQAAQDIELQDILGSPLYQELYNYEKAYLQSGTTMPAQYTELITKYVKPLLVNYVVYRSLDYVFAKSMNTSIVIKTDASNSRPVSRDEVNNDKKRFLSLAMWQRDAIIRYLTTQNSLYGFFPLLTQFTSYIDTIQPDRGSGYGKTGLFLKRRNGKRNYWGPDDSRNLGSYGPYVGEQGSADGGICCR